MKRSKFTDEQIVRILQEASAGVRTQVELCREHGISRDKSVRLKSQYQPEGHPRLIATIGFD